jgi:hypothetical protein
MRWYVKISLLESRFYVFVMDDGPLRKQLGYAACGQLGAVCSFFDAVTV